MKTERECLNDGYIWKTTIVIAIYNDIYDGNNFVRVRQTSNSYLLELQKKLLEQLDLSKSEEFWKLSDCVKVLGGFVCDKSVDEWESEVDKLKWIPNKKIQNILRE